MQLPIKAHYATVAMLAMAARFESGELLQARVIAANHDVPNQFLGQILQQLRTAGLITSVRGASGGFRLARHPEGISISEVVDAVCSKPLTENVANNRDSISRVVSSVWQELSDQQIQFLDQISLSDLVQRLSPEPASMFFI